MERYSSFRELKEHDVSKIPKPVFLKSTEKEVKAFIELLRKSVVKTTELKKES